MKSNGKYTSNPNFSDYGTVYYTITNTAKSQGENWLFLILFFILQKTPIILPKDKSAQILNLQIYTNYKLLLVKNLYI